MGTNYYVIDKAGDKKHFGKRSAGWDFTLHVYPDEGIRSLEDWLVLLSDKNVEVRDDSGRKIKLKLLLRIVLMGEGCAVAGSFGGSEYAVLNPFTQRFQPPPDAVIRNTNDYCYAIFPSYFCLDHDFG
tara:strand:+ start:82 stop:465 length:384 start_codon:yes stop_codon:yes gene_type:complete